jgi:zinc protease
MRRRLHKGFGYYMRQIFICAILVICALYIGAHIYVQKQTIPVAKILKDSVLKDRKFDAKVKEIKEGNILAYFLEEHSNPIISMRFLFQNAGFAYEPEDKQGVSTLLAEVLVAGGGKYNAEEFKDICAEYGIKLEFSSDTDNFSGVLEFPSEHRQIAVKIFRAALYQPNYEENYFNLAKSQQLTALRMQKENPDKILTEEFKQFIFAGHPYERNALGQKKIVENLTIEDVESYRQTKFAQNNLLIGLAGDLTVEEAGNLLNEIFSSLPEKYDGEKFVPLSLETSGAEKSVERNSAQAVVKFAVQGTFRDSVDFYPLYMANSVFGASGLTSRLNKVIREEKGLTYGIYTYLTISDAAALIEGSFSATPENFDTAKQLLLKEWQNLGENGVSEEELVQAKKSLISAYNLRFSEIDSIASMLLAMQKYNLGIDFLDKRNDYINEVSLQEVNAAAKKYFKTMPDMVYIGALPKIKEKK